MTAEVIQFPEPKPTISDVARYALEGVVEEADITPRDAMIAEAVYRKAYWEGITSTEDRINDLQTELNALRRTRRITK